MSSWTEIETEGERLTCFWLRRPRCNRGSRLQGPRGSRSHTEQKETDLLWNIGYYCKEEEGGSLACWFCILKRFLLLLCVFLLEELQAFVVQVEARISCEVQLLKLRRKRLWQSHLSQLVAAQVHTLRRRRTQRGSVLRISRRLMIHLAKIQSTKIHLQKTSVDPESWPHSKQHNEGCQAFPHHYNYISGPDNNVLIHYYSVFKSLRVNWPFKCLVCPVQPAGVSEGGWDMFCCHRGNEWWSMSDEVYFIIFY